MNSCFFNVHPLNSNPKSKVKKKKLEVNKTEFLCQVNGREQGKQILEGEFQASFSFFILFYIVSKLSACLLGSHLTMIL